MPGAIQARPAAPPAMLRTPLVILAVLGLLLQFTWGGGGLGAHAERRAVCFGRPGSAVAAPVGVDLDHHHDHGACASGHAAGGRDEEHGAPVAATDQGPCSCLDVPLSLELGRVDPTRQQQDQVHRAVASVTAWALPALWTDVAAEPRHPPVFRARTRSSPWWPCAPSASVVSTTRLII